MLLAIGYRLLLTYKIHRIVTITSSFVNSTPINCAVGILVLFADVTCKGVTFRLAKGSHLDSRAQRYCNKI